MIVMMFLFCVSSSFLPKITAKTNFNEFFFFFQSCFIKGKKLKKWIACIFLFVIIAIVIGISCAVCFGIKEYDEDDGDETYDQSKFNQKQKFNGSFQITHEPMSNETQVLLDLQEKLAGLYKSSPALGRFFSEAETLFPRNESAVVQYRLTFVFPEEQQADLKKFTLSREMVYNVFRQFLYDQDENELGKIFIEPFSLKMDPIH
uniref:SEA domain-containing protein n=1 Tax=Cyprinodon variegatus TaxID=28743 RepID=A0A3Q2EBX3_CYPVA